MNLKERVTALEGQLMAREIPYDRIYSALRAIDRCTAPPAPGETEKEWQANFIRRNGTHREFINERTQK